MDTRWLMIITLGTKGSCNEQETVQCKRKGIMSLSQEVNEYSTREYHYN